ncbi:hypothetical protein H9L39_01777 [Fusarium oxysporum f. sp. albedinis]|nr:hypothetical protein H9L39_01777 [Fusarium oxysporum f. sp. albedinis]
MKSSGVQIVGVYDIFKSRSFGKPRTIWTSQRQASVPGANGGRTGGVEQRDQAPSTVWVRPGIALNLGSGGLKL